MFQNATPAEHPPLDLAVFQREEPLRRMVDDLADFAVFTLDPQGLLLTWNRAAERMMGYTADEVLGRHFSLFYPPEAIERGQPANELATATAHGTFEEEGWRVRKDGSAFWMRETFAALRTPEGALLGFGKAIRNLTRRTLVQDELRDSRGRIAHLAEELARTDASLHNVLNACTAVAIIATDPQGLITTFNCGAEHMLGYTAEEVVYRQTPMLFHFPPEVESRAQELGALLGRPIHGFEVFIASIAIPGREHVDWTYIHRNGTHLTVCLSLAAVRDDHGQTIGFLGIAENVTRQRQSARELAAANAQRNDVLECTSDGIMTIDRNWKIVYGNRHAIDLLPDFALGEDYWTCFAAVRGTPVETILRTCMETRVDARYDDFYTPYKQWFRVRIFPHPDGISAFFQNVSEEKEMQERLQLEQMLREKRIEALSHMAGGLAHEISNPLAIIHARASDLYAKIEDHASPPDPAEIRDVCQSIIQTSDRATRILRGLRGFAREASNDPMEFARIDDIVSQCVELQETRFKRHAIELRISVQPDIPVLLCRETQIGQILTNLLNNAFDAIEHADSTMRLVSLNAWHDHQSIFVDVLDTGPGIQEEFRDHLMDPFFTTKTKGLGIGVGLSLSRAIAQEHGGTLILCNDPGPTCFRLQLPPMPEPVGPHAPAPEAQASGSEPHGHAL